MLPSAPARAWCDAPGSPLRDVPCEIDEVGRRAEEAMGEANVPAEHTQACKEARFSTSDEHQGGPRRSEGSPSERPAPAVGLIWRITDRKTFAALRQARRVRQGPLTVSFIDGSPTEPPRVAYAIGRKVGGAVKRNRLRRRLRAIVLDFAPHLRPGAYLIGAAPEAIRLSTEQLRATMIRMLQAVDTDEAPARRAMKS